MNKKKRIIINQKQYISKAWSDKKKKHKKTKAFRKSVKKEPTVKRCLLVLDLKEVFYLKF